MASRSELEAVIRLAGNIDPSLRRALLDAHRRVGDIGNAGTKMGKLLSSGFKMAAKAATVGAAAIGVGLLYVANEGLQLASDLTEVQNVVDVTFGDGAKQINEWSKQALDAYGLSELSAKQFSSTLGALMKSSGVSGDSLITMSENLTALSGDFASFYNLNPAEAFEKIKSGLSGETEPLRALGIDMSVASLEAYALSKGIKTAFDKMSSADKTMLRYNFLLEKSTDAQGDFARTQDSYANQRRLFIEGIKQMSAKIMKSALPSFTALFKKGNELIHAFMNSPEKVKKLQDIIERVANKAIELIPIVIGYVQNFIGFLGDLYNGAVQIYQYISDNWSVIEPLIIAIVTAMLAWKAITVGMKIYKGIMVGIRAGTVAATIAQWGLNAAVLANPMTWIVVGIAAAIGILVAGIYLIWKNWDQVWGWIVGLWQNSLAPFFQGIGNWFSGLWNGLIEGFKSAWNSLPDWIQNIFKFILNIFKGYINLYIKGINFLIGALNKIHFKVPDWVPGLGGKEFGINIPLIPEFANGGFTNQPSIFGEAGPEAAIPLKRTPRSLSLLNQTARAIGADVGTGSTQFVFAPVINGGNAESIKSELQGLASDMFTQFEAWMEAKRRESFA